MAADLLDERHDCGTDTLQGAEYTSDGTPCVLQMKAKCAGDAVGGTRTSEKISTFLRDTRAGPSTTIKRLSWTPLDDIIRGNAALDALDSKLLRVQQNHAYRRIAEKCAGCATPPISDTSIFPQVLGDDTGLYTPFEPSDSTPTQKIEQSYQIPHSLSESTTTNDRLPTKAPKTTNAPEHGTVNATEPSKATACKGAPGDPTKSGSICQSINFLPSETIFLAPQQGTKSSIPTPQTKERPTQPLDAHGFPDICASTSTAGQAVGNDSAGGYSGGSDMPCATPIVHLATDDVWYDCLPTDQDILDEDQTVSHPTKFRQADAVEISAKDGFLDGGASRDTPRICIPGSLDGKASPESPASMYYTPEKILHPSSPTISDATTLVDTPDFGKSLSRSNSTEIRCVDPQLRDNGVSKASVVISAAPGHTNYATGADLPPELFDHIIRGIIEITVCGGLEFTESNRYVGACALTCRYWAKKLRSWNFGDMQISSERQLIALEALLRAPPIPHMEPVSALIRRLRIIQDGSRAPWLHRVTHLMTKHQGLTTKASLELELTHYGLTQAGHPFRSVFYYLPRTTPFLYDKFWRLSLRNMRFDSPHDLFTLIRAFRNLRFLNLIDVTWNTPSHLQSPFPFIPETLQTINVTEGDDGGNHGDGILPWMIASAVAFTAATHRNNRANIPWSYQIPKDSTSPRTPLIPVTRSEVLRMLEIVETFRPQTTTALQNQNRVSWNIHRIHSPGRAPCAEIAISASSDVEGVTVAQTPDIWFRLAELNRGRASRTNSSTIPTGVRMHLRQILLNFYVVQEGPMEQLSNDASWATFFRSTLQLDHLQDVKLKFRSDQEREAMVDAHASMIGEILRKDSQKLRCRYRYVSGNIYSTCTSSDEDLVISALL